jgi:hypothetical protein
MNMYEYLKGNPELLALSVADIQKHFTDKRIRKVATAQSYLTEKGLVLLIGEDLLADIYRRIEDAIKNLPNNTAKEKLALIKRMLQNGIDYSLDQVQGQVVALQQAGILSAEEAKTFRAFGETEYTLKESFSISDEALTDENVSAAKEKALLLLRWERAQDIGHQYLLGNKPTYEGLIQVLEGVE